MFENLEVVLIMSTIALGTGISKVTGLDTAIINHKKTTAIATMMA